MFPTRGAEHTTQEKVATEERKCLRLKRSIENAERQRRGASPLEDDDVDESGDYKGGGEDLGSSDMPLMHPEGPAAGSGRVAAVVWHAP